MREAPGDSASLLEVLLVVSREAVEVSRSELSLVEPLLMYFGIGSFIQGAWRRSDR